MEEHRGGVIRPDDAPEWARKRFEEFKKAQAENPTPPPGRFIRWDHKPTLEELQAEADNFWAEQQEQT